MPRGPDAHTTNMKSVTLIPKSLDLSTKEGSADLDTILGKTSEQSDSVFGSYLKMIDAVSYVTVPETIIFPKTGFMSYDPDTFTKKFVQGQ